MGLAGSSAQGVPGCRSRVIQAVFLSRAGDFSRLMGLLAEFIPSGYGLKPRCAADCGPLVGSLTAGSYFLGASEGAPSPLLKQSLR